MDKAQNIEQQIKLLSNLRLGFGIAALLFLALAIFLFFYLKIPQVFSEYRGKSAQRELEAMAANSSESGRIVTSDKKSKGKKKGNSENIQRRHYTDSLTDDLSQRISQEISEPTGHMGAAMAEAAVTGSEATDVLNQNVMGGSEATDILDQSMMAGSEATDILDQSMIAGSETTGTLREEAPAVQHTTAPQQEGTMVLDPAMLAATSNSVFEIERSIILIHTEKVI